MSGKHLLNAPAFQQAAFEAIKAKHQNLHALLAGRSDPLLGDLADMILLVSAQLAWLGRSPEEPRSGR